ncbi:MAG: ABC transporter ATP-binding protein/permease [Clostridia bacterium]|nr:ABC transporter ATP-binding protein/permease [Clostridia bacterium]
MRNFKQLLNFLKGNRLIYFAAVLSICLSSLFSTTIPVVIRFIIDSVIGTEPIDLPAWARAIVDFSGGKSYLVRHLWICGAVIVLLTALHGFFLFLKGRLAAMSSENSGKMLREKLYNHIMHLPYDFHVKNHAGDLIQRCTSDVETVQNFISSQFVEIGQSVTSFSLVFVFMLSIDPLYSLVSIVLVPFILLATVIFFRSMKKVFKLTDESEGRMTSTLQESLTGVRVVKAFGAQNFETDKFDEKNVEYRDYIKKILYLMSNFWSSTDFLCLTQLLVVIISGVYWTNTGRITLGTLVAFISYAGMLIWPVRQLGQVLAFMGQTFVSLNRIQEILDHPEEETLESDLRPEIKGDIEFTGLSFGYDEKNLILKDLSFKIQRGQTVAVLGATGSGKSSIVHLLTRLYDYKKGSIKIDGTELSNIDRKWLRKNVGIVLQEPFLFSKSIKENIRFGKTNATDDEIHTSSSIAAIHEAIQHFDNGYDTIVGERGVTLSGGQRQRIAIARAVIRDVPILIFDDSLSAVDMETDAFIRKALKKRSRHTTTIIISHRITTLAEADIILVLENGQIKQKGTHNELIAKNGLYRRVWELQSSLENELENIV